MALVKKYYGDLRICIDPLCFALLLTKITTKQIIHCVKKHFARYVIPKVIVSDCGSQFISHDFSVFCKNGTLFTLRHHQDTNKKTARLKLQ